jgi:ABC-type lipoprotein release transport system permease subunit
MFFKMALRNILRQKRRSLFTSLGMMFGAVVISFSVALTDGTYNTIIKTFTESTSGHLQIHSKDYLENPSLFKNTKRLDELSNVLADNKDVVSFSPRVYSGGMLFHNKKSSPVYLKGISPKKEVEVTGLQNKWDNKFNFRTDDENSVVLSHELVKRLNSKVSEEVIIISQGVEGSIANDVFKIVGTYDSTRLGVSSNEIYMPIKALQNYLSLGKRVHEVAILLSDFNLSDQVSNELNHAISNQKSLEGLSSKTWKTVLKDFYTAMEKDKAGNNVSLGIIIFIVGIGILNTVLMSVLERTREFGVLKAIGTKPSNIFKLIMIENAVLSVLSLTVSSVISFFLVWYFSVNEIKLEQPLNYGGFDISGMGAELSLGSILIPCVVVFSTTMLVSLYPAIRAAKILPIQAMNEH